MRHPFTQIAVLLGLLLAAAWAQAQAQALPQPSPQRVALADVRMVASEGGRQTLKYLASCALKEGMVLTAEHQGERLEFPGGLGLAPAWHQRALNSAEQRWLSACLLARTNFFGVPVQLSMRSDFPSNAPGLHELTDADAPYTLEEGAFFGNLFSPKPTRYVCGPQHDAQKRALFEAKKRLCALPNERGISACGMVYVGECNTANLKQDGIDYRETVSIFLEPPVEK